ncbi:Transcription initiation factor IIA large subunit-like protein [Hapsidospora chrysogenum ATCC 11550]|uniref:Transcription initiation factor IIA large subunit n=1 Tax=Hapsidospora chrysogenum (strain ATCC 11550 / CBS 779.69 / DSM 880 / IAM 14645 / JCM 23072 / IMI 49137) TaxID=857340 RepID=A0A086T290_HAPC1|nr:Transcription initiation factor IIA large subunit-like protein [Hapsidospora chrysogenum ATCC 11550]
MSNSAVGNVYQTIIEEVINSSRVDFEESGVEESVLEEMRQAWQQKLTQLDVARFPWDPKPDPPPPQPAQQPAAPTTSAPPTHSQAQFSPQLPQSAANGIKQEPEPPNEATGLPIKQEPREPAAMPPPPPNYGGINDKNSVAANRAAQLVQQQYGERAVGSINAIQAAGQQSQSQAHQHQQQKQQQQQQQQQQPSDAQQQSYQQQAAANGHSHIQNAQTDGAGDAEDDFEGVLLRRDATGDVQELGRVEIDRLLHEQIAAKAKSMEGGGLMLPLKEATRHRTLPDASRKGRGIAAHDGGYDEEEDDEDAINSDLDDPNEGGTDDEVDDEGLGHIMLCMYDKVQRVKNKWKCTLKDGVLLVNGKEYVFHKATGEYEW